LRSVFNKEDLTSAKKYLDKSLAINPNNQKGLNFLIYCKSKTQVIDQAFYAFDTKTQRSIEIIKLIIAKKPDGADAYYIEV
jgi:Tfp pilus assembly protein PilF